jgi:hypothetical protein
MNIDEMIADAKAEEQANIETRMKKAIETKKPSFQPKSLATIDLEEYVMLRQIEADHKRLLELIIDTCELSYNREKLRLIDDDVLQYIRVIYPEEYETRLAELKGGDDGSL